VSDCKIRPHNVILFVGLAMFGVFVYVSLFVQREGLLADSPTRAGAAFLPMTIIIVLLAPIAGRISDRVGSRWLMSGGLARTSVSLYRSSTTTCAPNCARVGSRSSSSTPPASRSTTRRRSVPPTRAAASRRRATCSNSGIDESG